MQPIRVIEKGETCPINSLFGGRTNGVEWFEAGRKQEENWQLFTSHMPTPLSGHSLSTGFPVNKQWNGQKARDGGWAVEGKTGTLREKGTRDGRH